MASQADVLRSGGGGNGAGAYSSSPELSSPPVVSDAPSPSPTPNPPQSSKASDTTIAVDTSGGGAGVSRNHEGPGGLSASASATKPARGTSHSTTAAPPKTRKPRQKKNQDNNAAADAVPKEPKIRKPRASGTTTRKRQKVEVALELKSVNNPTPAQQPKTQELVTASPAATPTPAPPQNFNVPATTQSAQNGNHEAIANAAPTFQSPPPPPPPTRSSGQNYDPIRSATIEAASTSQSSQHPFSPPPSRTPPRSQFRASASPAISSIIDPPAQPASSIGPSQPPLFPQFTKTSPVDAPTSGSIQSFPSPQVNSSSILTSSYQPPVQQPVQAPQSALTPPDAMNLDTDNNAMAKPSLPTKKSGGTSTGPPSSAASPKPARQKEAPPPIPSGSGLLSSSLFGGGDQSASTTANAPNIVIHVPLKGEVNKVINFAQMAEAKYGFDAMHPRLAAQRERMARVAAASAALEKTGGSKGGTSIEDSGDELDNMSVDNSEDPDRGERDIAMGGTSGADDSKPDGVKQRRKRKVEDYDREDPFVDDTELAWEEQAAASKDGFFVYSGPLVPEGEKPQIERADGTVKRGRGRGRGGGPGSRGGRGAGGGPGSRGGGVTRKPRISKAQRFNMEREKIDREKMAVLAAKPVGYPG